MIQRKTSLVHILSIKFFEAILMDICYSQQISDFNSLARINFLYKMLVSIKYSLCKKKKTCIFILLTYIILFLLNNSKKWTSWKSNIVINKYLVKNKKKGLWSNDVWMATNVKTHSIKHISYILIFI